MIHSCNVIHFDLKPANVLLDEDLESVICDFGIANIVGGDSTRLAAGLDNPNLIGLTPAYASPELFQKLTRDKYKRSGPPKTQTRASISTPLG